MPNSQEQLAQPTTSEAILHPYRGCTARMGGK